MNLLNIKTPEELEAEWARKEKLTPHELEHEYLRKRARANRRMIWFVFLLLLVTMFWIHRRYDQTLRYLTMNVTTVEIPTYSTMSLTMSPPPLP